MDLGTGCNILLQAYIPWFTPFAQFFSLFGQTELYLFIMPLILWCFDKKMGFRLLFLLTISTAINYVAKILFHSPRPYWVNPAVNALAYEPTFGMPSGHAQISVTFLGCIGVWLRRTYVWIVLVLLTLLVGLSRMYLGVHFLADILMGWIIGIMLLLVFYRYEDTVSRWVLRQSVGIRVFLAVVSSFLIILVSQAAVLSLGTWQIPPEWSSLAYLQTNVQINPVSLRDSFMVAGMFLGTAIGAIITHRSLPYTVEGSRSQRCMRYILGIITVFLLWMVLGLATRSFDMAGYALQYIRAAIVALWITIGAPYVFLRLGLMRS